jgi:hypothetical protein
MITENNEPVGRLNRDQIIAALSERAKMTSCLSAMNKNCLFGCSLAQKISWWISVNKSNLMLVMENGPPCRDP